MIDTIKEALDPAKKQPGRLTRLVANMEWALESLLGVHDLVEHETRLNHILPEYHDPFICTYDLSRFDASVVIDIMRSHPMVNRAEWEGRSPAVSRSVSSNDQRAVFHEGTTMNSEETPRLMIPKSQWPVHWKVADLERSLQLESDVLGFELTQRY